jgi:hypothetical protein
MFGSFPPSPLVGLRLQSLLGPRSRHCYGIISLTDPEARLHFGSAMDSPVLPHNPQSTANEGDSRYAQPPQVGGRLLTPATLHSQVGCRVGSLLVPFPPATPIPPYVKCEMFLRRQEAQKSVSKKQQRAEEEHGHKHPILCRIHRCRRCIGDKSPFHSSCRRWGFECNRLGYVNYPHLLAK